MKAEDGLGDRWKVVEGSGTESGQRKTASPDFRANILLQLSGINGDITLLAACNLILYRKRKWIR